MYFSKSARSIKYLVLFLAGYIQKSKNVLSIPRIFESSGTAARMYKEDGA